MLDFRIHFRRLRKMLAFCLLLVWKRPGQIQNKIYQENFPVEQALWKNIDHILLQETKKLKSFQLLSAKTWQTKQIINHKIIHFIKYYTYRLLHRNNIKLLEGNRILIIILEKKLNLHQECSSMIKNKILLPCESSIALFHLPVCIFV